MRKIFSCTYVFVGFTGFFYFVFKIKLMFWIVLSLKLAH